MKKSKRLSLALIVFSLFSISCLVSSVSAQEGPPGGPPGEMGPPGDEDPCMNMPPGPAQADCYRHKDDHRGPPGGEDCEAMGMKDGSPHVDPPQNILDQVKAEYEANCKNGNCFLGEGNYKLLEDMGHMRAKVDCFLKEGEKRHHDEHGGPNDHRGPN